jgi:hypothetical protein
MRIFLASILNFVLFHCYLCINNKILGKNFVDWTIMGGATIIPRSLKTTRSKQIFQDSQKYFLFFKSYMTLYGFMCQSWAKMSKCISLSLRLSGIEFSLVTD